jgi:2-phospho-L-lactate guanylyltransferase
VTGKQFGILVVPIKPFQHAKGRLAESLSPSLRARLARECAEYVLAAADGLDIVVVTDASPDNDVPAWAAARGVTCLTQKLPGLNGAVRDGITFAQSNNYDIAVIAHSDVPLATSVRPFLEPDTICIVPDQTKDGTNLLSLPLSKPAAREFQFHYGPGSFLAHEAESIACGFTPRIAIDACWALDLDEPHDLLNQQVKEALPWLTT